MAIRVNFYTIAALAVSLSACMQPRTVDETEIVRSVLTLLQAGWPAGDSGMCVDSAPRGEPLAIYQTMEIVPNLDTQIWHRPEALRYPLRIGGLALTKKTVGKAVTPDSPLPRETRMRLTAAARQLAIAGDSTGAALLQAMVPSNVPVRWWLRNRIDGGCKRTFVLSRIVMTDRTAFVTVTANHRGTTYAIEREPAGWRVSGQWGDWLY